MDKGSKRTLVAMAAAALASPVVLAPTSQSMATTNFIAAPSEAATISGDALIRTADYDPVRKRFIARSTKKTIRVPRVIGPPFASPPLACSPVASWTDVNANVCIKYVCAGGGFQIRCLPAPVLD